MTPSKVSESLGSIQEGLRELRDDVLGLASRRHVRRLYEKIESIMDRVWYLQVSVDMDGIDDSAP